MHLVMVKGKVCKDAYIKKFLFLQGIKKTAKSNFGGGNTDWEEKNLGTYAFSETRLIEITENICKDSDKEVRPIYYLHSLLTIL